MTIPDADHVIRYCKRGSVDKNTKKPVARAFEPQVGYPNELSVNWLEHRKLPTNQHAIAVLRTSDSTMNPDRKSAYVILNVGEVKESLTPHAGPGADVVHSPGPGNPSHADIVGYAIHARQAQEDLASLAARSEIHPGQEEDPFWANQ